MSDHKEQWERELHRGLEQMDGWVDPVVADVHMWERIVVEEQSIQRKKLRRELTIFWMVAVVVLILVLLSFVQMPMTFVVVQVGSLIVFPLLWVYKVRKKVANP